MVKNEAGESKSPKQQLLELLESRPKIYSDALKWSFYRWFGVKFSSLFPDVKSQVERESILRELRADDAFRIIEDPKGSKDFVVRLTEKGRDSMIGLFYSCGEKRQLKRLFKKIDSQLSDREREEYGQERAKV